MDLVRIEHTAKSKLFMENGAKSAAQLVEDRLSSLEQKVEQGSTANTNPTDEWPRKMWEIDLGEPVGALNSYGGGSYTVSKPRNFNTIKIHKTKPDNKEVFDASFVANSIRSKYKISN